MGRSAIVLGLVGALGGCGGNAEPAASGVPAGLDQELARITATCADTAGVAEVRRKGSVRWEKLAIGTTLREGDWVRTADKSYARLRFANGYLDLRENTAIVVDTAISVQTGTVVGVAERDQPFVVRTDDGSEAKITGAVLPVEFRLTRRPSGALEIAASKGIVDVTAKGGVRHVGESEASDLGAQQAGDVLQLLPFPKILSPGVDARFLFKADMTIPLQWTPVSGAAGYEVEVARDTEFHALFQTDEPNTATGLLLPAGEGVYVWRVASRDADGRLGEFGFARRLYCEPEEPLDLLVGPRDGARLEFSTKPEVAFSWRPMGDLVTYELVVDRDGPTPERVVDQKVDAQSLTITTLAPGAYHWGVYAMRGKDQHPIFLKLRAFTLQNKPGPKLHVEVKWKAD